MLELKIILLELAEMDYLGFGYALTVATGGVIGYVKAGMTSCHGHVTELGRTGSSRGWAENTKVKDQFVGVL